MYSDTVCEFCERKVHDARINLPGWLNEWIAHPHPQAPGEPGTQLGNGAKP